MMPQHVELSDAAKATASGPHLQLRRVLGMRDLVSMIVGSVIGSGIFLVPGAVLRAVDKSVTLAAMAWFAGGVLSLLGALTYGELSAMKPQTGGLYVYIRDCFGSLTAFLFGWTMFFVISSGTIAGLAVAFSAYLGEFLKLSAPAAKAVSILMIATITAINVRGTRQSADLLNLTTTIKVTAILLMSIALLWVGRNPLPSARGSLTHSNSTFSGFGLAMISVLWAYEGWQYATYSAGEIVDPQRNFPRAFFTGLAALIGIYLFANLGYLVALGPEGVSSSSRVAASAVAAVIGIGIAKLVAIAILISMFSAANSMILTAPRVYYAMAKDRLFFKRFSEVHPRFGTPAFAIIGTGTWSAVLAASGTFEQLLTYVVSIGWIFYALAAASIFVYRRRAPDAVRPFRVPGYPLTPLIFILSAMGLVGNTAARQPGQVTIGLGIVFLGVPAYLFWQRKVK